MTINFIVNDPAVAGTQVQQISPSRNRKRSQPTFVVDRLPAEKPYAENTFEFVAWQAREAALRALGTFKSFAGPLKGWMGRATRKKLNLFPDHGEDTQRLLRPRQHLVLPLPRWKSDRLLRRQHGCRGTRDGTRDPRRPAPRPLEREHDGGPGLPRRLRRLHRRDDCPVRPGDEASDPGGRRRSLAPQSRRSDRRRTLRCHRQGDQPEPQRGKAAARPQPVPVAPRAIASERRQAGRPDR